MLDEVAYYIYIYIIYIYIYYDLDVVFFLCGGGACFRRFLLFICSHRTGGVEIQRKLTV